MFVGIIALLSFLSVPSSRLLFIHMPEFFIFLTELIELFEKLTQVFLDEVLLDLCELLIELASSWSLEMDFVHDFCVAFVVWVILGTVFGEEGKFRKKSFFLRAKIG